MHDRLCAHDLPAIDLADRLVSEADAEDRRAPFAEAPHGLDRDPRLLRRARPRRDDEPVDLALEQRIDRLDVVAHHLDARTELAEVLHEVVSEGIVVIDDHEPGATHQSMPSRARSSAFTSASDLLTVSMNSSSGTESATTPAPAESATLPSFTIIVRMVIAMSMLPL